MIVEFILKPVYHIRLKNIELPLLKMAHKEILKLILVFSNESFEECK